jgi:hypothetical protein
MYPKAFFESYGGEAEHGICFVIMPFAKTFDPVFRAFFQRWTTTLALVGRARVVLTPFWHARRSPPGYGGTPALVRKDPHPQY